MLGDFRGKVKKAFEAVRVVEPSRLAPHRPFESGRFSATGNVLPRSLPTVANGGREAALKGSVFLGYLFGIS